MVSDKKLVACESCGQIQTTPPVSPLLHPYCVQCDTSLASHWWHNQQFAVALAVSALILYVPSILLPLWRMEKLGQSTETNILLGVWSLLDDRHYFVGGVVLLFSLVLPPLKLLAILLLYSGWLRVAPQAWLHRWVERLGRWGMLDVLVVAVLVAFVKLGGVVHFLYGTGLVLFTICVLLSVLSSSCLHLPSLWKEETP